ncbi:hypothetical protein [Parabacteroides johnsonii]|uniref:hypothetical protein n=1 Tax=Parabacteroides johnsonii TaxID=387661 RepID=UPI0011DD836D|nr:hypothetical protein [Parabacteroides johnsonii]
MSPIPILGASYPDACCVDGKLQDLDYCDENGLLYDKGEDVPCPFCRTEEFIEYDPFSWVDHLSRKDKEEIVLKLVTGLNTGLIYYQDEGRALKVFTSYRLKHAIDRMVKGSEVLDENKGLVGTVISEHPFICGCEMCIRVDFGESSDVYACSYFAK